MPTIYERDAFLLDVGPGALRRTIRTALQATPPTAIFRLQPTSITKPRSGSRVNRITMVFNGRRRVAWPEQGRIRVTELTAGAAIVVPRRSWSQPHGPQQPHRYLSIDCYPTFTRFMCEHHNHVVPGHGVFYSDQPANACARHLLEAVSLLPEDEKPETVNIIFSTFLEQIMHDCQHWTPSDPGQQHWRAAVCWIQDHLSPEVGRTQIAAAIGIHPNHLSRICQQQTGERLSDLLTRMRIERAQDLLADTDLPIRAIVSQAGYRDDTHFRKRFKSVTGITPGAFRRQAQRPPQATP